MRSNNAIKTNEMTLLLLCLPSSISDNKIKEIGAFLNIGIDWNIFYQLIERHRVHAKVYRILKKIDPDIIPELHLTKIKKGYERNTRQTMLLASELVRLVKMFRKEEISMIPLKGTMTALRIYSDVSFRNAHDIDILIEHHQLERAYTILTTQGYECVTPFHTLSAYQRKKYLRAINHTKYVHSKTKAQLEVHSRFSANPHYFPIDFNELNNGKQTIVFAGEEMPRLSDETLFLHLFAHGSHHFWFRLSWLCDVVEILQNNLIEDWSAFLEMTSEKKLDRPVVQSVMVACILFEMKVPEAIQEYASKDKNLSYFVDAAFYRILMMNPTPRSLRYNFGSAIPYQFFLRPGLRYKINALARYGLCLKDWTDVKLPDILFPFIFLLRPFLWLKRKLNLKQS